jgi:hypothetical protein
VLLSSIDPRVRKIRNQAFSYPLSSPKLFAFTELELRLSNCANLRKKIDLRSRQLEKSDVTATALEPGAYGIPYYCTSDCVRFGCTRLASCVDSNPKKKTTAAAVSEYIECKEG